MIYNKRDSNNNTHITHILLCLSYSGQYIFVLYIKIYLCRFYRKVSDRSVGKRFFVSRTDASSKDRLSFVQTRCEVFFAPPTTAVESASWQLFCKRGREKGPGKGARNTDSLRLRLRSCPHIPVIKLNQIKKQKRPGR